jgi:hypothetical protein
MTATANLCSSADPGAAALAQHDKLAELYTALVGEVHKLLTGDGWRAWLQTAARFHQYSFLNTLLIHAQRPDATDVAGYRVWQSLGRQVHKGQRGIRIVAPMVRRTELGQEQGETRPSDPPARSGPAGKVVAFRPTYVWDVAQTSGKPLAAPPQSATAVTGQAPAGLWDALAAEVARDGFRLRDETLPGTMHGLTDFGARVVAIDPGADDAHRVVTLAQELAHIRLHDPLAGGTDTTPTTQQVATESCRGDQEVEAESVAYLVATVHGIDTAAYAFDYLAGWASSKGDDIVGVTHEVGARVVRTAHDILDRISTVGAANGDGRRRELQMPSARLMSIDGAGGARRPAGWGIEPTPRRSGGIGSLRMTGKRGL